MAYKMGVTTHLSSFPAEALGGLTLGVTPLEMAVVYATLADGGWRNSPIAITKVVFPDGRTDSNWGQPHRVKVLSEAITGEETSILHQNVLGGTAVKSAIGCPTAAKTGTTNEFIDAWLDGFNSEYSTVVWMGYPTHRVEMTSVHGETQQGGRLPADIWHAYMAGVTEGKPCAPLNESSAGISYSPFFGKLATTGQAQSEERKGNEHAKKKSQGSGGTGSKGKSGERAIPEVQEAPAPKSTAPPPPPSATPVEPRTGGAAPH
jgi:membrane peptidoglycan carboxypeptidase